MSELFYCLEFVRAYLDDLLVLTNARGFDTHVDQLGQVLKILQEAGLKVKMLPKVSSLERNWST
jgi:hypothetical protein